MSKPKRSTVDLLLLGIIYFIFITYYYISCFGTQLKFIDTDDLMRIVRIKEFFQHYDLSNSIIARCNYPDGCDLHWTRLYDFILIALSWFINLFGYSIDKSITYACFIVSPILGIFCATLVYKIFSSFLAKNDLFLASVLFCVSPYLISTFLFGRPDHHAFILCCMLIFIHYTIKMIINKSTQDYVKVAIATTACVWASPETLIVIFLTDIVLLFSYFNDFKLIENLYFKNLLTSNFIGLVSAFPLVKSHNFIGLPICVLLLMVPYLSLSKRSLQTDPFFKNWHFVCLMLMMLFLPTALPSEYDKISVIHASLFMCLAMLFAVNMQIMQRKHHFLHLCLWGCVISFIFLSMFPDFLKGMAADVSPLVKSIWLSKIRELQSPLSGDFQITFIAYSFVIVSGIVIKTRDIMIQITNNFSDNHTPPKHLLPAFLKVLLNNNKSIILKSEQIISLIFITLATCYLILSCFAYRMLPFSITFGLPLVIYLGMSSYCVESYHRLVKIVITMFLSFILFFLTVWVSGDNTECEHVTCSEQQLYKYIDNLSNKPVVIMANSNHGPNIVYYTKHYAVGAPYHRQQRGIILSHIVTEMDLNINYVSKALQTTNTKYILVYHALEKQWPNSFASNLIKGKLPNWINPIILPEQFKNLYSLFEVDQELLELEIQSNQYKLDTLSVIESLPNETIIKQNNSLNQKDDEFSIAEENTTEPLETSIKSEVLPAQKPAEETKENSRKEEILPKEDPSEQVETLITPIGD